MEISTMGVLIPTIDNIPVLLPPHTHPEFGDPRRHYHIDYRYCLDKPEQSRVIFSDDDPIYKNLTKIREFYQAEVKGIDLPLFLSSRYDCLIAGKCPHRGLPVMPIGNGVLQCPGHGLCFNQDGKVIKDYYLRVGTERELIAIKKKYSFEMKDSGSTDIALIETFCGTRVGSLTLNHPISWSTRDLVHICIQR